MRNKQLQRLAGISLCVAIFFILKIDSAHASTTMFADQPRGGVALSDEAISQAIKQLKSPHAEAWLPACAQLVLYFGKEQQNGIVIHMYGYQLAKDAQTALAANFPIDSLLQCLDHKEPLVRIWGMQKLSKQHYLSNTTTQNETMIRDLLAIQGLVSQSNLTQIENALKLRLADSDENARAAAVEAIVPFASSFSDRITYIRGLLDDSSPIVRASVWSQLTLQFNELSVCDPYLVKRLQADLADQNDDLCRAALAFLERVGWRSRVPTSGEKDSDRLVMTHCEPLVFKCMQERNPVKGVATRLCRFYPQSEPLLIDELTNNDAIVQTYTVASLADVGTVKALQPLRDVKTNQDNLKRTLSITIKAIEDRIAGDKDGNSVLFYTVKYIDADDSLFAKVYPQILKHYGFGGGGFGGGPEVQIRVSSKNRLRWRVLMTILDTPDWRQTLQSWDGSDLFEKVKQQ